MVSAVGFASAGPVSSKADGGEQLLGAWQLAALEELDAAGKMHTTECSGILIMTSDGHMSVQVMYVSPTGVSSAYSHGGYEASFGRYELDSRGHRLIYRVEGALVRSLVGQRQERRYALSGDQLVITPVDSTEHWRVTWKRY